MLFCCLMAVWHSGVNFSKTFLLFRQLGHAFSLCAEMLFHWQSLNNASCLCLTRYCGRLQTTILWLGSKWSQFWRHEKSGLCRSAKAKHSQQMVLRPCKWVCLWVVCKDTSWPFFFWNKVMKVIFSYHLKLKWSLCYLSGTLPVQIAGACWHGPLCWSRKSKFSWSSEQTCDCGAWAIHRLPF